MTLPQPIPYKLGDDMPFTEEDRRKLNYVYDQLSAPDPAWKWPTLGKNAAGQELTLRDAFGVMKADIAALVKKLSA